MREEKGFVEHRLGDERPLIRTARVYDTSERAVRRARTNATRRIVQDEQKQRQQRRRQQPRQQPRRRNEVGERTAEAYSSALIKRERLVSGS